MLQGRMDAGRSHRTYVDGYNYSGPPYNRAGFNPRSQSILWKELVPIVLACAIWVKHWQGLSVMIHCDNMGIVAVVNSGYRREQPIMHLLRCLFFIRATYQFSLYATHISGDQNSWADALSRGNTYFLRFQAGDTPYQQSTVPNSLVTLLLLEQPDWTSSHWTPLYRDSLRQAQPHPLKKCTAQGAGGILIFVICMLCQTHFQYPRIC